MFTPVVLGLMIIYLFVKVCVASKQFKEHIVSFH